MAKEINDNLRVRVNRPTDFRFGPFDTIEQANALIPLSQRYNGLIFGVYVDYLNKATSDMNFYYYYNGLTDSEYKPLGSELTGNGTTNYIPKFTSNNSIGNSILVSDENGVYNTGKGDSTFFGYQSGLNDDGTDNQNVFVGYQAGRFNTTGRNNSFFGAYSGRENTTGGFNSFFGLNSGYSNITGVSNSFFGVQSGLSNTTGFHNSFFGLNSGLFNTTGYYNSFFGLESGRDNTTGKSNAFFGLGSGSANTTGNNNSFFGFNSGRYSTIGAALTIVNNSVFLGYDTRSNANDETNQIVIGHQSIGLGSNTTVIGNTLTTFGRWWGNLLLGTSTDSGDRLRVDGTVRLDSVTNATGDIVTIDGNNVLRRRTVAEVVSDLGIGLWTLTGSDIYRNSAVAIGRTTIPTNSTFSVQSKTSTSSHKFIQFLNNSGSELYSLTQDGVALFNSPLLNIGGAVSNIASGGPTIKGRVVNGNNDSIFRVNNSSDSSVFEVRPARGLIVSVNQSFFGGIPASNIAVGGPTIKGGVVNGNTGSLFNILTSSETLLLEVRPNYFISYSLAAHFGNPSSGIANGAHFKGNAINTTEIFAIDNSSNSRVFSLLGNGDISYFDGSDWTLGTTTGTKIGTATTQKLGFYGATPIVQPSGDILTALSDLGLVNSPTIDAGLKLVPFSSVILMDNNYKSAHTQTAAISYTRILDTPLTNFGNRTEHFIQADGVSGKPTFSADFVLMLDNWNNGVDKWNHIIFKVLPSGNIGYWIYDISV